MTTTPTYEHGLHPDYRHLVTGDPRRPGIRLDLLLDLVAWAEHDDANLAKFQSWGSWEQGSWSALRFDNRAAEVPIPRGWNDPVLDYREPEEADEAIRQEILRGACGTSFCMAGQAVHQAGYRLVYTANSRPDTEGKVYTSAENCVLTEPTGEYDARGFPVLRDVGESQYISVAAQHVLGIDHDEANVLFGGDNSLDEVRAIVNLICENRNLPWPYPESGVWNESSDDDDDDEW
jgi:hypothetical protein